MTRIPAHLIGYSPALIPFRVPAVSGVFDQTPVHQPSVTLILVTDEASHPRWIRRGLVVMMPGSQAWVRRFESPLDPQAGWPGRYIDVRRFGGLPMVLLQQKDPLELFVKRREFLPGSGFLSRRDMIYAVKSDVKPNSFLPSTVVKHLWYDAATMIWLSEHDVLFLAIVWGVLFCSVDGFSLLCSPLSTGLLVVTWYHAYWDRSAAHPPFLRVRHIIEVNLLAISSRYISMSR